MKIIKHSGAIVDYNSEKLKNSLLKSGAGELIVKDILRQVEQDIFEGMTTKQIYKLAFGLLKKASNSHAARYNLRQSLELLGPAGFFFEKYVARLFQTERYDAQVNLTLQGKCVSHEIDVVIQKNNVVSMVECKFHARREAVSDVKIPMYILSRFNDLKDKKFQLFDKKQSLSNCWIVTNNRFSADAIQFGNCSGLHMLSWDFPLNQNLKTKIDPHHLYPITCLTTLSLTEKDKLLILDVILVKEIVNNSECLEKIGLSPNRIKNVLKEAAELCSYI